MSLTLEWRHRIDRWQEELLRHFYRPLGIVEVGGFFTTDQLTAEEAGRRAFHPMPAGTPWGGKWEYGWFKGGVLLPGQGARPRNVLKIHVGAGRAV